MNKCYYRITWENYPSDKTPLNELNLNKIDVASDEMDNRIISLDTTKFDKSEAQLLVRYIEYDEDTGIFNITHYNGASYTIDTLLEKLAINFDYDYQTQRLIIELSDGTVKYVDLSALLTQYEFLDSETIAFQIQSGGEIKAIVKDGSIEEKHLRPDYLSEIKIEAEKSNQSSILAKTSELNSSNNAKLSESWAVGGTGTREGEDEDNAKEYARRAKESADVASSIITETFVLQSEKGIPGGIPTLDKFGKIPYEQIPDMEGAVLGVKGNVEENYRTGYVSLTPYDIGTLSKNEMESLVKIETDSLKVDVIGLQEEVVKKQSKIIGAASTITSNNLTALRALISNSNGKVAESNTTLTELEYLHGVTGAVQTQLNNKLSLSGGTVSGTFNALNVSVGRNGYLRFYDSGNSYGSIKQYGPQQMVIRSSSEDGQGIYYGVRDNVWSLSPDRGMDNGQSLYLGSPNYKYHTIFAGSGTINTSDRNLKENIQYLTDDDIYIQLFMKLLPCSFTYKNKDENDSHDRTHIGFIAQDVEQAMEELGLTSLDFAGFCKDQKICTRIVTETITDELTNEEKKVEKIIEEVIDGEYIYSLRYQEFIAIITKALQQSFKKIDELDCRLSQFENKVKY